MAADDLKTTLQNGDMGGNNGSNGGDQEAAFLEAFDAYSDALHRHARFRINDHERAIDLVHDTFTKVWGYVRAGHTVESYKPFLYKVLNNLIIDAYRKRDEASLDALMAKDGIDEGTFADLQTDTTEALIDNMDGAQALKVVSELPDIYREVLILRFVDELKPREISELVEVSENVVSVRIHRGLDKLREIIDGRTATIAEKHASTPIS